MRIAILTSKPKSGGYLTRIGTLPEPTHFPINLEWDSELKIKKIEFSFNAATATAQHLGDAGAVLSNLAAIGVWDDNHPTAIELKSFCTEIEKRHGRQVVEIGGKLRSVNKLKEDAEIINFTALNKAGEPIEGAIVTAKDDAEAVIKMRAKLLTDAEDAVDAGTGEINMEHLTAWMNGGKKLSSNKLNINNVINIHNI